MSDITSNVGIGKQECLSTVHDEKNLRGGSGESRIDELFDHCNEPSKIEGQGFEILL